MSMHQLIPIDAREDWNSALNGVRHSFAHTWDSCHAMHLTTGYTTYLYRYEDNGTVIVCPLAERIFGSDKDIVTPYGFSGFTGTRDCPDFPEHWKRFAAGKEYVCGYISINPLLENKSYFDEAEAYSSTSLFYIDLDRSLTDIFESLDSNRRRQIRNYRKHESGFVYDREMLTGFFIANYFQHLERFGLSRANYFSESTLRHLCSLENVFMVGTAGENGINSVYIFADTPYEGQCLFNVALPEAKESTPLLLWCGLKYFRSKKIPVMNLGGGSAQDDNVARSKQRYGAYALPFRSLRQIYDIEKYERLCRESGASDDSEYFPAFRNPNLKIKPN